MPYALVHSLTALLPNKNEERLVGNSRLVDPEMHGRKKDAQTKGLKTLDQRSKEAKKQRNEHNAPAASVFLLVLRALAKAAAGV